MTYRRYRVKLRYIETDAQYRFYCPLKRDNFHVI